MSDQCSRCGGDDTEPHSCGLKCDSCRRPIVHSHSQNNALVAAGTPGCFAQAMIGEWARNMNNHQALQSAQSAWEDCCSHAADNATTDESLANIDNLASVCPQRVWWSPKYSDVVYSPDPEHVNCGDYTIADLDGRYRAKQHAAFITACSPPIVRRMVAEIRGLRNSAKNASDVVEALERIVRDITHHSDLDEALAQATQALTEWKR